MIAAHHLPVVSILHFVGRPVGCFARSLREVIQVKVISGIKRAERRHFFPVARRRPIRQPNEISRAAAHPFFQEILVTFCNRISRHDSDAAGQLSQCVGRRHFDRAPILSNRIIRPLRAEEEQISDGRLAIAGQVVTPQGRVKPKPFGRPARGLQFRQTITHRPTPKAAGVVVVGHLKGLRLVQDIHSAKEHSFGG